MLTLRAVYLGVLASVLSSVNADIDSDQWEEISSYFFQSYTEQQCQAPYETLNATGTFLVDPNDSYLGMNDVSWTVAVSQPYSEGVGVTNFSLYLGTPSGFDFRPGNLNFSGCALIFEGISDNLNRRGQDDDGLCMQTFNEECVKAISKQASDTGFYLTISPTNNSPAPGNLTAGSLPRVCGDIQEAMISEGMVPQECAQFVGPSMTWNDGKYSNISIQVIDITGPNSTVDEVCTFNTTTLSPSSPTFPISKSNLSLIWEFNTLSGPDNSTEIYDNATQNVLPLLIVTFPPANDSRVEYSTGSSGFMNCVRANNSLPESRVAPPLPAPTALRKLPIRLSKGTTAGIAIGAVVGVVLLVGALVWLCLGRRRAKKANEGKAEADRKQIELEKAKNEEEIKQEAIQPMVDSNPKYEIDGKGGRGEMDTGIVNELEGSRVPEMEGSRG